MTMIMLSLDYSECGAAVGWAPVLLFQCPQTVVKGGKRIRKHACKGVCVTECKTLSPT